MSRFKQGLAGVSHRVLNADGFFISYNADLHDIGWMRSDNGGAETAIATYDGHYYILNGDHRDAYESLVDEGLEACLAYFNSKPELKSSWSE